MPSLRKELLGKVHDGHQGISICRVRARQSIWWPGISLEEPVSFVQCWCDPLAVLAECTTGIEVVYEEIVKRGMDQKKLSKYRWCRPPTH